jgi:alkylhydroperoxidase family enzyme
MAAMLGLENYVGHSGFDPALLELVKLHAAQINECAYCLDIHTKDAQAPAPGYAVVVWRETPFFSERERAALAWPKRSHL